MVKAEWGAKRQCPSCGARYYDLRKNPPCCPKCGAVYEADRAGKSRRGRAEAKGPALPPPVASLDPALEALETDEAVEAVDEEEDETLMEDASDLGGEDDVSEVMEHVEEGELVEKP